MAAGGEQPGPVVRTRAGLHADHARRQRRDQLVQFVACHAGANQLGLAGLVDAVHGEHVLGEINADGHNSHGLPLLNELMRDRTSHRGTELPIAAMRLVRDGEVPFIR